ncbi:peroxidase family protein [Ruegeria sp. HKCCD8929]|uniref:peroxidase family protein n=1 Tax=Ruegeria sp. HKCCD8929 TaxID=2683006 RepID=UPI0014893FF8|nr:peroxidase family protein [Ruegeria sp. HKCCD8929]
MDGSSETLPKWHEVYVGGTPAAELEETKELAQMMMAAQLKSQAAAGTRAVDRAFHTKSIAAFKGAELRFADDLPMDLQVGFAQPGARYPATVRFSNASSQTQSDEEKDLRGLAVRVFEDESLGHDLLATNFPVPHARNARQFVVFAHALAGGRISRVFGLVRLCFLLGFSETLRMVKNVRTALRLCDSVAVESYWSRGAIAWGPQAVRYTFKPAPGTPGVQGTFAGPTRLSAEYAARQAAGDLTFNLFVQRFVSESQTPIEDAAHEWDERVSSPVKVAELILPKRDLSTPEALAEALEIDRMGFNPWNTTEEFRPLGNLNRARKAAYDASAAHRQGLRFKSPPPPIQNRIFGTGARAILRAVNRRVPWHKIPFLLVQLLNLDALRHDLRQKSLMDTDPEETVPTARAVPEDPTPQQRMYRTHDGSYNDLSDPKMGAVGATFGRNMPAQVQPNGSPNPIVVARKLMDRQAFIPAKILNVLAASWIQFQVHDWVAHERRKLGEKDDVVSIPDGYPDWQNETGGDPEREMRIAGNVPKDGANDPFLFANENSHWWDGSQVYGVNSKAAMELRDGPKLRLDTFKDGDYLPENVHGFEVTGFNESWWLGLSTLHTLFAREHNVICDALMKEYPTMDEERVYQTARLIVSALIAKIHTVEWTPAVLGTEALDIGMKTNWYGPPKSWLTRLGIWLTDTHALKGIPETQPDHHTARYSLTEEFATVYRMHPLIPDDYIFYDFKTGKEKARRGFLEIQGAQTDEQLRTLGLRDCLYSQGIAHPGAITLHNFPKSLQNLERDGELIDLSVVDIVRTRARRVPRYNEFRKGLHMPPVTKWEDLTASPETNRILKELYGDIDKVDTVIGLLGETPPDGFGFSDTAFRVFILMASRRLQSDRFLTTDFRPEIYTQLGMDWIARNGMKSLLLRHFPEFAPVLPKNATAFAPWSMVSGG